MFVFNTFAGVQVALAALPAGLVYVILHYALGWESATWWATLVGALCVVPMDLLFRLMKVSGDDEGEKGMGIGAFFFPTGGGHLMFLPMYAVSSLAAVGLAVGFFAS